MRIAIYPFNDECMVFSDFKDLLSEDYCLSEAASPRIWGYVGNKIETADGTEQIKTSPKEFVKGNDILLIPDINIEPAAEKGIIKELVNYIPSVKKVICCTEFVPPSMKKLSEACEKAGVEFCNAKDFSSGVSEAGKYSDSEQRYAYLDSDKYVRSFKEFAKCETPIVAISGEWESTDKFPIQLKLLRGLRKRGYKVSMIGSSLYSRFFSVIFFPSFMFCSSINESDKPHLLSRFIKAISRVEEPDIIIIGVPGSAQAYNYLETDRFGVLPFITFQGINPDYFIFSTIYREDGGTILDELSNMCKYKYGVKPDKLHISNLDISSSTYYDDGIVFDKVNRGKVNTVISKEYADRDRFIINAMESGSDDIIIQDLIDKLSG